MKSGLDRVAARLGRAKPLAALLLGVLVLAGVVSVLVATGILAPDALRGTGAAVSGVSQGVRYVKVRLRGQNYLSLAEVQVFSAEDPLYNFAYQQPATQSSTFSDPKCQPTADRAVDGNMNGDMYANCSVTATNNDQGAWWQVDVGNLKIEQVGRIVLWNRTDCCPERLSDFDVQVSADGVSWTTIYSQAGAAPNMLEIRLSAVTVPGFRYVKVQLRGQNYLSLAEVQVYSGGTNVALNKPASQSSTFADPRCQPTANRAVDGNTGGDFYAQCGVTATNNDQSAWWQVDLGLNYNVERIVLFNRTDCCPERLSNFDVLASGDGISWAIVSYQAGVAPSTLEIGLPVVTAPSPGPLRFVKVQLRGQNYLSLAEFQAFVGSQNVALNKPASQSSTFIDPKCQVPANRAVDGNISGDYYTYCSVTATNNDQGAWWQVDLQGAQNIERIVLFNRTDCCPERLSNFDVLASGDGASWTPIFYQAGAAPNVFTIKLTTTAAQPLPTGPFRYVRVQLRTTSELLLAEVEVYSGGTNVALKKPASQSSNANPTYYLPGKAVDGIPSGTWMYDEHTMTANQTEPWWQVDLQAQYNVERIVVNLPQNFNPDWFAWDILGSADGAAWTTMYRVTGIDKRDFVFTLASARVTLPPFRFLKVQVRNPGTGLERLALAEVQLFTGATNVALNKPASQSSTLSGANCPLLAAKAVDGWADGSPLNCRMSNTNSERQPWWQVDLQGIYEVDRVVLVGTVQFPNYLRNFDVLASGDGVAWTPVYYNADVATVLDLRK